MTAKMITPTGEVRKPEIASALAPMATAVATTGVMKPASRHAAPATLNPRMTQPSELSLPVVI